MNIANINSRSVHGDGWEVWFLYGFDQFVHVTISLVLKWQGTSATLSSNGSLGFISLIEAE